MKYVGIVFTWFYNLFHREDKVISQEVNHAEVAVKQSTKAGAKPVVKDACKIAEGYIGIKEIRGKNHNKVIQSFFERAVGVLYSDETAWCAAFVNSCLIEAGMKGTGKLNARSFLNWGVNSKNPQVGDIIVFWRGSKSSWKGHVGFYVGESGKYVKVLGGNQSDKVCIKNYPKKRILGYRKAE